MVRIDARTETAALAGLFSGIAACSFVVFIGGRVDVSWSALPVAIAGSLVVLFGPIAGSIDSRRGQWVYAAAIPLALVSLALVLLEVWLWGIRPFYAVLFLSGAAGQAATHFAGGRPRPTSSAWRLSRLLFCLVGVGVVIAALWPVTYGSLSNLIAFVRDPIHGVGAQISLNLLLSVMAFGLLAVVALVNVIVDRVIDAQERRELARGAGHG